MRDVVALSLKFKDVFVKSQKNILLSDKNF